MERRMLGNLLVRCGVGENALSVYLSLYFLDYETNKAEYIKRFLNNVNWHVVEERINKLYG